MLDSMVLYGPAAPGIPVVWGGSAIQLGSYLRGDQPWDFGTHDLIQAHYTQTPAFAGAALAFEQLGVRKMAFPLLLPSGGASMSLTQLESLLRFNSRPGGWVDFQPFGVPSSEFVRFDILAGRWEPDHDVHLGPIARRLGVLHLDTQPLGYWPTAITLASTASMMFPGILVASPITPIIGDAPGLARIVIVPTIASQYGSPTWLPDSVIWGFGGYPSFLSASFGANVNGLSGWIAANASEGGGAGWVGNAFTGLNAIALASDSGAPGPGKIWQALVSPTAGWTRVVAYNFNAAARINYLGRFHAYLYAKVTPSLAVPWQVMVDTTGQSNFDPAMASSTNPIATLAPAVASGVPGAWGAQASPGFTILDCGELTFPPILSPSTGVWTMRVWANPGSAGAGVATPMISIAGIFLQPVSVQAGTLPRGLVQPSIAASDGIAGRFVADAVRVKNAFIGIADAFSNDTDNAMNAAGAFYLGAFQPLIVPTVYTISIAVGARKAQASSSDPLVHAGPMYGQAAVTYTPRFQFLKGL